MPPGWQSLDRSRPAPNTPCLVNKSKAAVHHEAIALAAAPVEPSTHSIRRQAWFAPLRSARRKYAEPAATFYSIRVEVRMIHSEDGRQRLTLREIHESCVCEIHRAIRIA